MLCDHTANTMGCFGDLQVSKCLCIYLFVCACIFKPSADLLCSAPEIDDSPVDEPELSPGFFLGSCGLQTNSVSHISLTVGEDPLGPAAVCSATGITRGLWSHRATAHFAGKERDDVMLLARHQRALIWCTMEERGCKARITPPLWFYEASSSLS